MADNQVHLRAIALQRSPMLSKECGHMVARTVVQDMFPQRQTSRLVSHCGLGEYVERGSTHTQDLHNVEFAMVQHCFLLVLVPILKEKSVELEGFLGNFVGR